MRRVPTRLLKQHRGISALLVCARLAAAGAFGQAAQPQLYMGVAWYPEQWPEAQWDQDLDLMQKAGINVIRIGEFAWSRMEPEEGHYDFDWLEHAVDIAAKHGIYTVLGTPTDAPPAWLTRKYPDVLRVDANGQRAEHGNRRQFSYASLRYRQLCRRIVAQMAERFGNNPNVIGWQIGNEYSEESFDPFTRQLFQQWLRTKYKTLQALNRAWTTYYWSQTYDQWDEIPMRPDHENPGLLLDYRRFVTSVWCSFQKDQLDVIRSHANPRQFITTNFGGLGWTDRFDHYAVAKDLDLASWDDYVGEGHLNPYRNGFINDLARGWKRKNFWVMETQPGFVNWAPISNSLDKGEVREMAWQDVGHGADCVAYWQWRSALNGQEQYHGSLVGPDGEPLPVYNEIRQVGDEFSKASAVLPGTSPVSEVALLHDYESRWAIDFQPHSTAYDQLSVFLDYYRPLRDLTQSVDVVSPYAPLNSYKVVAAPSLNVIDAALAHHLAEYVEQGGHLVLGPRSGMKNQFNALNTQRQPGPLVHVLGGRVEQFYALLNQAPVSGEWGSGEARIWAEMLSKLSPDAQVLMTYGASNGWLDHQPAVLTRAFGKGRITYIGALLDDNLMRAFVRWLAQVGHLTPAFGPVPENVEVCPRENAERRVFILLNHGKEAAQVNLPRPMRDVLAGLIRSGQLSLPPHGVAVLEENLR